MSKRILPFSVRASESKLGCVKSSICVIVAALLFAVPSWAEKKGGEGTTFPLGSGIFPPLQEPGTDATIKGTVSAAGWTRYQNVYGADFGIIGNIVDKDFVGMAASGIFHVTNGRAVILLFQASGVTNINNGKAYILGVQIALGSNYSGGETYVGGIQLSPFNHGKTTIYGLQAGIVNEAESVYGFQIGIINRVKNLHGLQVGVLNVATGSWLPVFFGFNFSL